MTSVRDRFLARLDHAADSFQVDAFDAIDQGASVLVAAPTSSGKTLVAEYAIDVAMAATRRTFYTAPIKALSNQKFRDLSRIYGAENVGLLTGDNAIRPDAAVVVMTTEVLRNMIYAQSPALDDLGFVILDEIHYLMDRYRGPVWEEVIVQLDPSVQLVCLSATVSNADEVVDWLESVRGPTEAVQESKRPVQLHNSFLLGDKATGQSKLFSTLDEKGRPNPKVVRLLERDSADGGGDRRGRGRQRDDDRRRRRRRFFAPRRPEVVLELHAQDLLPAIYFVFSRAGCDDAVRACAEAGIRLIDSDDELNQLDEIVERRLSRVDAATATAIRADVWVRNLRRGIAAHHAGMVPLMKEAVEEAFAAGLIRVVFATETLAMGVNLPARSVVIESLSKYRGDGHSVLTAGEYTQLTGRAGRRGIDERGDAVVLWSPFVPFEQVADLASSGDFRLTSAFRPTWNMAANLVATSTRDGAVAMLGSSLAQFQSDKLIVSLRRRREKVAAETRRLEAELRGVLGDQFDELRAQFGVVPETGPVEAVDPALFESLRPGDIVIAPDGEPVAVLSTARRGDRVRLRVVSSQSVLRVISGEEFGERPETVGHLDLPHPYQPNLRSFQNAVARRLRNHRPTRRRRPRGSHQKPADLARPTRQSLKRLGRLDTDRRQLDDRIGQSEGDLVVTFDALITELEHRGYVDGWSLTSKGRVLAGIYHESDLVVAECLVNGLFDDLDAAELAALASCLVYEHRSPEPAPPPWFPRGPLRGRFATMTAISEGVIAVEQRCRITESRPPDPGFVALAHGWALDVGVDDLLAEEISGGDFVRTMRQLVDLLRHLGEIAGPDVAATAYLAARRLDRGLVAATSPEADLDDDDAAEAEVEVGDSHTRAEAQAGDSHTRAEAEAGDSADPQG